MPEAIYGHPDGATVFGRNSFVSTPACLAGHERRKAKIAVTIKINGATRILVRTRFSFIERPERATLRSWLAKRNERSQFCNPIVMQTPKSKRPHRPRGGSYGRGWAYDVMEEKVECSRTLGLNSDDTPVGVRLERTKGRRRLRIS